jgi:DNA mismatch repair protein MutS
MEGRGCLSARSRSRHRRPLLWHPWAKLAGLPKSVTARAEEVLGVLEKGEQGGALARLADDLPLFNAARRRAEPALKESAAEALLRDIRPDELTPREALDLIYRLKGLAAE